MQQKFDEDQTCSFEDMIADRQTLNRRTRSSQYSAPLSGWSNKRTDKRNEAANVDEKLTVNMLDTGT